MVGADITTAGSGYSTTTPPTITFTAAPSGGTTAEGIAKVSQTPSKPKLLVSHTNRLFATSADTAVPSDTIYCSDILDGESFDLAGNSIRVGGGDGDPIVALTSWFDFNLLVFKERSIWVVNANPAQSVAEWQIRLINNRVGCVAARTVQQVGSDVLFMSRDGVQSVKTIESGTNRHLATFIQPYQRFGGSNQSISDQQVRCGVLAQPLPNRGSAWECYGAGSCVVLPPTCLVMDRVLDGMATARLGDYRIWREAAAQLRRPKRQVVYLGRFHCGKLYDTYELSRWRNWITSRTSKRAHIVLVRLGATRSVTRFSLTWRTFTPRTFRQIWTTTRI